MGDNEDRKEAFTAAVYNVDYLLGKTGVYLLVSTLSAGFSGYQIARGSNGWATIAFINSVLFGFIAAAKGYNSGRRQAHQELIDHLDDKNKPDATP